VTDEDLLRQQRWAGVLRADSKDAATAAAEAAFRGGMVAIEVTFSVPDAAELIRELTHKLPAAIIGAGTITDLTQAQAALDAGARFFVSPHLDPKLCEWFFSRNLFYVPGALTPSELMRAHSWGAKWLKVFPAQVYGPSGLKGLLQPLPFLQLIATGGVSESTAEAYLDAGAAMVCVGSEIFSKERLAKGSWAEIESVTRTWAAMIQKTCAGKIQKLTG
jgi:2-dehydro-3-deoxyphosphogluconate aldolase / (4S)-4-hydroxy-2-oxoglutarate aldolase